MSPAKSRSRFLVNTVTSQTGASMRQPDEPAKQQIVVELLHQLALRAHRVESLQQQRPQQLLRRDRGPAGAAHRAARTRPTAPPAPRPRSPGSTATDDPPAPAPRSSHTRTGSPSAHPTRAFQMPPSTRLKGITKSLRAKDESEFFRNLLVLTASQATVENGRALIAECTARTSFETSRERDGEASSHGRDRVGHVPLGPDRRRRGVGKPREGRRL